MLPSPHISLALLHSNSNKVYQFWENYFLALCEKETPVTFPPIYGKNEGNFNNFTQIIGHAEILKKGQKSKKNTLSGNIGDAQHAQACPGCPPLL